jgi:hypothetical protein
VLISCSSNLEIIWELLPPRVHPLKVHPGSCKQCIPCDSWDHFTAASFTSSSSSTI